MIRGSVEFSGMMFLFYMHTQCVNDGMEEEKNKKTEYVYEEVSE